MRCLSGRGRARSGGNFFSGVVGCSFMLFGICGRGVRGGDFVGGMVRTSFNLVRVNHLCFLGRVVGWKCLT